MKQLSISVMMDIELREYLDVVNSEGADNHTERQEMNVANEDSASDAFVKSYLLVLWYYSIFVGFVIKVTYFKNLSSLRRLLEFLVIKVTYF